MNHLPFRAAVLLFLVLALSPLAAWAQVAGQQPIQTTGEQVVIPDSRAWTIEQAVVNLRSSEKGVRLAALYRLANEPGDNIRQWIVQAAQYDPEVRIRWEAVRILGARNEPASLPVLMYIGENDADDRVRTEARTAAGMGVTPQNQPQPNAVQPQPGQPQPQPQTQPQEQPPIAEKRYDEYGNELPPGYLDMDAKPVWGADEEVLVDEEDVVRSHSGFMPMQGFDGQMGAPRDTLSRSKVGLQLGYSYGRFDRIVDANGSLNENYDTAGMNRFTNNDLSLTIDGSWSPFKYLEIGLAFEVLTVEKSNHQQRWEREDNRDDTVEWEKITPDMFEDNPEQYSRIYHDSGYSGAALGFLSLDLKSVFVQTDIFRMGIAFRLTFPTHTGDRMNVGIGASDLFLPKTVGSRDVHETRNTKIWGMEPGIVLSVSPVENLTIYSDINFLMSAMKYDIVTDDVGEDENIDARNSMNMFLIPHIGLQYRFLEDSLGAQVAIAPVMLIGSTDDNSPGLSKGMAGFVLAPGVSYKVADLIDVSLVLDFILGDSAAKPFQCTGLQSTDEQETKTTACGTGRSFGLSFKAGYEF